MQLAYLALGSNRGPRRRHLAEAIAALGRLPGVRVRAVSALYETAFVGAGIQEPYLNACVMLETDWSPEDLLARTQELERAAGREPDGHMAPRPLDIDLLIFGDERRTSARLELPHPRLGERRFVLQPLADLDPDLVPPGEKSSVRELLRTPDVKTQAIQEHASGTWWEARA
jgi:2-amino-4-hydroxy-6-hydroxymethyldihydropteridine diphosphokinase